MICARLHAFVFFNDLESDKISTLCTTLCHLDSERMSCFHTAEQTSWDMCQKSQVKDLRVERVADAVLAFAECLQELRLCPFHFCTWTIFRLCLVELKIRQNSQCSWRSLTGKWCLDCAWPNSFGSLTGNIKPSPSLGWEVGPEL